ncbi:DUF4382 domain-containing protein [Halovivax cerinus]|uniref:DUF4382 domain-containing protein n=1 Tax=Halovivax cerinus TaxID=1487865 RepID=A0ABD5NQ67_9EURY|nr:DUF4382 domain-containing protein [Halovivax cerinus]
MNRRTFVTATAGGIALTAGCTSSLDGFGGGERGTVRFYVSDEPNRIDDFETLDVTVSAVAFKPAGEDDESGGNESETDGGSDASNESETDDGNESDAPESGRGGWDEYDLDDPTVDLTQLKGPKATVLDELDVPTGEYVAVDMFVADTHAVLTDGTETTLKIPSERLKIRTPFTVAADEELDFVYDIAPKKAGQSGRYILTPVISESGTEAEIEEVDATRSGAENE